MLTIGWCKTKGSLFPGFRVGAGAPPSRHPNAPPPLGGGRTHVVQPCGTLMGYGTSHRRARRAGLDVIQGRVRMVVADGDQRVEAVAQSSPTDASAMRCVSRARALCRAAPTARRSTESAGARTCSSRSQPRARASSDAVRSSRCASSSRNRTSRSLAVVSNVRRRQVLTDVLLMLGNRLLPAGVGVDRLGVGPQTAGPRTSGSPLISPSISRGACWGNLPRSPASPGPPSTAS